MIGDFRDVSVCAVPHRMIIVEGGVLFCNRSGFYGVSGRLMFEYRSHLWYLDTSEQTFGKVAVCHIVKIHKLLEELIGPDHMEADGSKFQLRFRDEVKNG